MIRIISYPDFFTGEAAILTELFEQGLAILHLRKPNASEYEIKAFIDQLPTIYHNRIIISHYHKLAKRYNLKGIHYNIQSLEIANTIHGKNVISACTKTNVSDEKTSISRLAKTKKAEFTRVNEHFFGKHNEEIGVFAQTLLIKGYSAHILKEISDLGNSMDYIYLSPIFSSISKATYKPKYSLATLKDFILLQPRKAKLIALGGIHAGNVEQVIATGFDGMALLGYIWEEAVKTGNHRLALDNYARITKKIKLYS